MQRVTNSILVANFLNGMNRNIGNMSILQNQLSSGKLINRASDDPYGATRMMQLNSEITENKQYNDNIKNSSNWLDTTDSALSQAGNVFARIKELMVKAGDGAYGKDEIATIKNEVVQKVTELGTILNSSFDGNYIFGGTKSTSKPVIVDSNGAISYADKDGTALATGAAGTAADPNAYAQIKAGLKAEISQGVTVNYNKTAVDVLEFNDATGAPLKVSAVLNDIINNLGTSSTADLSKVNGQNSTDMDSIIKNLLKCRADVGSMQNGMESAQSANEDQTYNMTSILSSVGDVDYTQKTMEYSVAQTVYTAALQTSSKVLSKTLLDYL